MVLTFFHRSQPKTRHVAHVTFWLLILLAIGLVSGLIGLDHDDEPVLAVMAALSAFTLLLPAQAVRRFMPEMTRETLGFFELLLSNALILTWVGSLGAFRLRLEYDAFLHLFVCFLVGIALIEIWRLRSGKRVAPLSVLISVFGIGFLLGGANEFVEWGIDELVGTSTYGEMLQPSDTIRDLSANTIGLLLALVTYNRIRL